MPKSTRNPLASSDDESDTGDSTVSPSPPVARKTYTSVTRYDRSSFLSTSSSSPTRTTPSNISSKSNSINSSTPNSSRHDASNGNGSCTANTSHSNTDNEQPSNKDMMDVMKSIISQNKGIMERLNSVESSLAEMKEEKKNKKERIEIPVEVRHHVKVGYAEARKNERKYGKWNVENGKSAFCEENQKTSHFIRNFAAGLHADLQEKDTIINAAIKTYFESQRTMTRKSVKDPAAKKLQARLQRKIHKATRRRKSVDKFDATKFSEEVKKSYKKALVPEMMSSEEEKEDEDGAAYYSVKPLPFRTKEYKKLIRLSDRTYFEHCSKQSKEQYKKRMAGSPSKRPAPNSLEYGYDEFIEK